jgi:hypothetical protein
MDEVFDRIQDLEFDCPECRWGWNDGDVCPVCQKEGRSYISVLDFIKSPFYDESLIEDLTVECPECPSIEDDQYCCTTCWSDGNINVLSYLKEYYPEVLK